MIYKYLSIDSKSEKPLAPITDRTLKFALVADLNDPFENLTQVRMDDSAFQQQIERQKDLMAKQPLFASFPSAERDKLVEQAVSSLKADYDGTRHNISELHHQRRIAHATSKNIGILSLTNSSKNGLMWSHYTDKHQGYVLGFDDTHPWFNPPRQAGKFLGRLIPVEYEDERVELNSGLDSLEEAFRPFFRKSKDWSYEEEQRVLTPLNSPLVEKINETLYVREYPAEMLKEVIFGCDIADENVIEIKSALEDATDVKYFRAMPSSVSYGVEIIPEEDYFGSSDDVLEHWKEKAKALGIGLKKL